MCASIEMPFTHFDAQNIWCYKNPFTMQYTCSTNIHIFFKSLRNIHVGLVQMLRILKTYGYCRKVLYGYWSLFVTVLHNNVDIKKWNKECCLWFFSLSLRPSPLDSMAVSITTWATVTLQLIPPTCLSSSTCPRGMAIQTGDIRCRG